MSELSHAARVSLKCIRCKSYLSISPILGTPKGYLCGRCPPHHPKYFRVELYEILAQSFLFPCKWESFGCTRNVRFDDAQAHEDTCEFRTFQCPILNCGCELKTSDLLSHFEERHQDLVIATNQIAVGDQLEIRQCKIIKLNNEAFMLEMFVTRQYYCWLALRSLKTSTEDDEVLYNLEVQSNDSTTRIFIDQLKVQKYSSNKEDLLSAKNLIHVDKFKEILQSEIIYLKITLDTNPAHVYKRDFLEELECHVCQEYMTEPIFACIRGHAICSSCKAKLVECPMCKGKYEGTRCFALEKLGERPDFPCKNQTNGCKFVGSVRQIHNHEQNCLTNHIRCPLSREESCNWKGAMEQVYRHCKSVHAFRTRIKLNEKMYRNLTKSGQNLHIIPFDHNMFKIIAKYDADSNCLYWSVGIVGASTDSSPKYCFTLTLTSKTCAFVKIRELCHNLPLTNDDNIPIPTIVLPEATLASFMENYRKLIYTIDIHKIS